MCYLFYITLARYLRNVSRLSPGLEFWRPYFFCGFLAQLVSNWFNDYFAERNLWLLLAFAVVLERLVTTDRQGRMRERQELVRNFNQKFADTKSGSA
jgi:hypothetical protein